MHVTAIQIAKLQGFSPIIATSSLKHTDYLKSLGAAHVLDRSLPSETILAELPKLTGGKPISYVYNAIAEEATHHLAYDALAPGGALVTVDPRSTALDAKIVRDKEAGLAPIKIAKPFAYLGLPGNTALGVEVYKRLTEWIRTGAIVVSPSALVIGDNELMRVWRSRTESRFSLEALRGFRRGVTACRQTKSVELS